MIERAKVGDIRHLEVGRDIPVNGTQPHALAQVECVWGRCRNAGRCFFGEKKGGKRPGCVGDVDGVTRFMPKVGLDVESREFVCMNYDGE